MERQKLLSVLACALILLSSCNKSPSETPATELVAVHVDTLPTDPADTIWSNTPAYTSELLLQDVVEPRMLVPSTPELHVQAVSDGKALAIRLEWQDQTNNNLPGAVRFSDACAIQLPQSVTPDVPDPLMGDQAKPVEITYWRAAWQAAVDGRGDTIQDLYPNASVDHYPFKAAPLTSGSAEQREMALRYAPARAEQNPVAGPHDKPVQDYIAVGPGSLSPAESTLSSGQGQYTDTGWQVVLTRPLPSGLKPGGRSVIAFAVWQGEQEEIGSRKMRSIWIPLFVE